MIITIRLIIARLAVLAVLFTSLVSASEPRVIYQIQGLNQDLVRVVQQHLDQSLQASSRLPNEGDIQHWYQQSSAGIQHILAAYGYFEHSIHP